MLVRLDPHGDIGKGGKRNPGMRGIESAFGPCFIGHAHSPEILRDVWRVGTSSLYDLGYNGDTPDAWFHTSGLLYSNGSRQLINSIGGEVWLDM